MAPASASAALAAAPPGRLLPELLPWLIVLLGVVAVSAIVIYFVRRWLDAPEDASAEGFTLHGLRRMHARGDLTDDEFERAKAALIERARGATSGNPADPRTDPDDAPPDAGGSRAENT